MELQLIQEKIFELRGQYIMLDYDLAEIYGIETRVLKQAVMCNARATEFFGFAHPPPLGWRTQLMLGK